MLKQLKVWKFSKMTAKPKVMEKVVESHWIWRTQKSTNPVNTLLPKISVDHAFTNKQIQTAA